jgi:hypothetical protein
LQIVGWDVVRDREPSWRKAFATALPALPLLTIFVLIALVHAPVFTTVSLLGIAAVLLFRRWRA